MDVRGEIADCCFDVGRESAAVGEMATQAHPCGSYPPRAGRQVEEGVDGEVGILVVGGERFRDLVFVAGVGAGDIVGEGFRTGEFVVGRGCRHDVATAGQEAGEAGDGAGYWSTCGQCGLETGEASADEDFVMLRQEASYSNARPAQGRRVCVVSPSLP